MNNGKIDKVLHVMAVGHIEPAKARRPAFHGNLTGQGCQAITGLMDGDEEFMPLVASDTPFMAQQGGRVSLDGGQGTAQFVAHGCEQFCFE